ncbi:unnamed protein product, partial [Adineta steineri]
MENDTSLTARELSEPSNAGEIIILSNRSKNNQSLKSWIGPVQPYLWGNLYDCMKHMAEYGCNMEHSLIWVQDTLDGISLSAIPAQLNYIFNGYANLYKIVIDVICITDKVPVNLETDIDRYDGTSSDSEQEKRCRNITFVMYNPETFSFAILYAIDSDGNRQTCFAIDDQRIFDHLGGLFEKLNQEIMETELSIDNNDATIINTEESHTTDNVNAHLSSSSSSKNDSSLDIHSRGCTYELSVESHDDLTTSKRHEDHIICTSQTNSQSNFYSTHEEPMTTSIDNIQNVLSDMDTINRDIHQELNSTEESLPQTTQIDCHQEIADNTSTETNDYRMNTSLDSKARKSISKNIVHHTIRKAKTKRIRSSNNNSLSIPVTLSETTKKTASVVVSNVHSPMTLIIKYDPLNILKQPRRYRRVRMQNDLNKKRCPLVQAGNEDKQRIYPEIELPNNADDNVKLYVRVRVVTESGHSHPSQCVAPEIVNINISVMDNNNECVFLIITDEERCERRKIIKVHLFKRLHYFVSTEKNTETENLRLCKLEYTLCEQSTSGEYQLVSQPSYTSIIELMDKDVTVDATEVKPKQLCKWGGEAISVPLSTKCKKSDFHIECNDQELKNTQYKMEGKKLIIFSPESKSTNHLHLTISRKEYNEDISEYQMKLLHDDFIPHVIHGKNKFINYNIHVLIIGFCLSSGTHSMAIHGGMDLITGARFIVTNGTEQPIDIPIHWQCPIGILQRTFERIETLINDSQNCFRDLISAYADLYNIGLYLIVCNGNTCAIIGKEELESNKRHNYEHYTFLWCHAANMVFSPVYIQHINGHKMTTFKTDDVRARDFIESYLDGINQNLINPDQNSVEQDSAEQDAHMSEHVSHMMVDTAFSSTDDRTSRVRQPITTVNARVSIKQMQEEIDQLIPFIISRSIEVGFENPIPDFNSTNLNQIPPEMVAELIQERLLYLSSAVQKALELTSQDSDTGISSMIVGEENNQQRNIVQTNETNHSVQTNQGFSYVSSSEPIDMLNSNQASQSTSVSTSVEFQYETPSILVQPKGEWHNRNMKELANKGVSRLA